MDDESIQCKGKDGKLLFAWNPVLNTIEIVRQDMFYRIRLCRSKVNGSGSYQVVEQHHKNLDTTRF